MHHLFTALAFFLCAISYSDSNCTNYTGTYRYDEPRYDHFGIRTFKTQKVCGEFEMLEVIKDGNTEPFTHEKTIFVDGKYRSWFVGQKVKFEFDGSVLRQTILHDHSQYYNMKRQEIDWYNFGDKLVLDVRSYYEDGHKLQHEEIWKKQN